MKTSILVILGLALSAGGAQGQVADNSASVNQQATAATALPAPTARRVVERGANQRVWQWETYEKSPKGKITTCVHKYKELATGMHYWQNNQWVESKEQIGLLPQGGAHKYATNAYSHCIKINAVLVYHSDQDPAGDVQAIMEDYANTSCGWFSQLVGLPGRNEIASAVLKVLYSSGSCNCP
jgi:hypothetical protein